jgi:hypothetical protein
VAMSKADADGFSQGVQKMALGKRPCSPRQALVVVLIWRRREFRDWTPMLARVRHRWARARKSQLAYKTDCALLKLRCLGPNRTANKLSQTPVL